MRMRSLLSGTAVDSAKLRIRKISDSVPAWFQVYRLHALVTVQWPKDYVNLVYAIVRLHFHFSARRFISERV